MGSFGSKNKPQTAEFRFCRFCCNTKKPLHYTTSAVAEPSPAGEGGPFCLAKRWMMSSFGMGTPHPSSRLLELANTNSCIEVEMPPSPIGEGKKELPHPWWWGDPRFCCNTKKPLHYTTSAVAEPSPAGEGGPFCLAKRWMMSSFGMGTPHPSSRLLELANTNSCIEVEMPPSPIGEG